MCPGMPPFEQNAVMFSQIQPNPSLWNHNNYYSIRLNLIDTYNIYPNQTFQLNGYHMNDSLVLFIDMESMNDVNMIVVPLPYEITLPIDKYVKRYWSVDEPLHTRVQNLSEFCYLVGSNIFKPLYDYLV